MKSIAELYCAWERMEHLLAFKSFGLPLCVVPVEPLLPSVAHPLKGSSFFFFFPSSPWSAMWRLNFMYGYKAWVVTQSCLILSAVGSVVISGSRVLSFPFFWSSSYWPEGGLNVPSKKKDIANVKVSLFFFVLHLFIEDAERVRESEQVRNQVNVLNSPGKCFYSQPLSQTSAMGSVI